MVAVETLPPYLSSGVSWWAGKTWITSKSLRHEQNMLLHRQDAFTLQEKKNIFGRAICIL